MVLRQWSGHLGQRLVHVAPHDAGHQPDEEQQQHAQYQRRQERDEQPRLVVLAKLADWLDGQQPAYHESSLRGEGSSA